MENELLESMLVNDRSIRDEIIKIEPHGYWTVPIYRHMWNLIWINGDESSLCETLISAN